MMQIPAERFASELADLFDETFEHVHGIYLDRGTSLFETLATISAEEASRPVSSACASIAAQVEHVRFYLDVLENYLLEKPPVKADWGEIWRTVREVSPEEWEASKARLKASYERIMGVLRGMERWDGENAVGAPLAMLVHTAYHLGEIRQATCTLKNA
jgi:hypothetical protein